MLSKKKTAAKVLMALALSGFIGVGMNSAFASETIHEGNNTRPWATGGNTETFVGDADKNLLVDHSANTTINSPAFAAMTGGIINFGTEGNPLETVTVKANQSLVGETGSQDYVYWTGYIYNGEVNVNADTYEQEGSGHGIYIFGTSDASQASTLNMNVKNFESTTAYTAIHTREGTNAVANVGSEGNPLESFSATRTTNEGGVSLIQVNEGSTTNIYAKKVSLSVQGDPEEDMQGGGVLGTGSYGNANIVAEEVEINGDINLNYGTKDKSETGKTANFMIDADTLKVTGDIKIGSGGNRYSNFDSSRILNISADEATIDGDVTVTGNKLTGTNTVGDASESQLNLAVETSGAINGTITVDSADGSGDAGVSLVGGTTTIMPTEGEKAIDVTGSKTEVTLGDGTTETDVIVKGDVGLANGASMTINGNTALDATGYDVTVGESSTLALKDDAELTAKDITVSGTMTADADTTVTADTVTFNEGSEGSSILGEANITNITNNNSSKKSTLSYFSAEEDDKSAMTLENGDNSMTLAEGGDGTLSFLSTNVTTKEDNTQDVTKTEVASLDKEGNFKAKSLTADTADIGGVLIEDGAVMADTGIFDDTVSVANGLTVGGDIDLDGKTGTITAKKLTLGGKDVATEISNIQTTVGDGKLDNGAADLTEGINQNYALIQQSNTGLSSLSSRVNKLGTEIDNVGAISAALAGLHPLDYDGSESRFQIAAAVGTYDGTQAGAVGAFYHVNEDVMLSIGGSTSFGGDRKAAANLGVTFRVGQSGHKAAAKGAGMAAVLERLSEMEAKLEALQAENAEQKEEIAALKEAAGK